MNPFNKFTAALMLTAVLASCSSEEPSLGDADGTETSVTFICQAPSMQTLSRSYSDGQTADNLYYAVYALSGTDNSTRTLMETNLPGTALSARKPYTFNDEARPQATVDIRVAIGQTYTVIFFGAADGAPYIFNPREGTLTVDYEGATCNDELRDAFYAAETFTATKSSAPRHVTLHRPFAQVNVGTAWIDWQLAAKHSHTPEQTTFTVKDAYTTLDMFTGDVSGLTDATFALAPLPASTETFPKLKDDGTSDYKYLAMNYVLVDKQQTFACTFSANTFDAGSVWEIDNVPMQRNHRTNIYGDGMLTFTQSIDVEIDPDYDLDDFNFGPYQQLLAWATKGYGTLNLAGDIVIPEGDDEIEIVVPEGEVATINMNGHTIYGLGDTDTFWLWQKAGEGTLEINGPGAILGVDVPVMAIYEGEVILKEITSASDPDSSWSSNHMRWFRVICTAGTGKASIYGGFYYHDKDYAALLDPIQDVESIKVYGGYFRDYDPSVGVDSDTPSQTLHNFVADGYESIKTVNADGEVWYKVQPKTTTD